MPTTAARISLAWVSLSIVELRGTFSPSYGTVGTAAPYRQFHSAPAY